MILRSKDEVDIWYDYKPGDRSCLVFLHGFTGSSSAWDQLYPYFRKKGYGILLIDIIGHGLSDKPIDKSKYTLEASADHIKEILDSLGIQKAVFVGHCFGCVVSMEFYKRYPEYVEKLVFISTGFDFAKKDMRFIMSLILYFLYSVMAILFYPLSFEKNKLHLDYRVFKKSHDLDLKRIYHDVRVTSLRTILPFFKDLLSQNYEKVLASCAVPLLIIQGKKDLIIPKDAAVKMNLLVKNSRLMLLDSNHLPILNSVSKIKSAMHEFLKQ
ncbi:MAG: alpha/beta hydrolase [Candidatus Woesearchaeota archaeon]|nr:alpha/beta hydrolase [Candidatus Woesearchaeota archaeon]